MLTTTVGLKYFENLKDFFYERVTNILCNKEVQVFVTCHFQLLIPLCFYALDSINEAQCSVTCYALADEHLKWCQNSKHPFVVRCLQSRLCSSTSAGDLGRKLREPHLQSRRLRMRHVQMASDRGLSETAGLADVKVY